MFIILEVILQIILVHRTNYQLIISKLRTNPSGECSLLARRSNYKVRGMISGSSEELNILRELSMINLIKRFMAMVTIQIAESGTSISIFDI